MNCKDKGKISQRIVCFVLYCSNFLLILNTRTREFKYCGHIKSLNIIMKTILEEKVEGKRAEG